MNETNEEGSSADAAAVNPYATPRSETGKLAETVDQSFRPRTVPLFCGVLLGLLAEYVGFLALHSGMDLTPATMVMTFLELSKGMLAGIGVGIFVDSLLQKKVSLLAPGHWFLLLMVASRAAQFGSDVWGTGEDIEIGFTSFGMWYVVQTTINQTLVLLLLTPIALTTAEPLYWKALAWSILAFGVVVLLQFPAAMLDQLAVLGMISHILLIASTFGGFILGVAIFVLAIGELALDRPRAKSRDRYHWIGIFGPAGLTFLMIVLGIGFGYA
ncbi:hypothetical protein [Bremerella sp. P1]|uniref:hypothetical protein n=1 Tax=Bremerella sp. P1 TaxID=3026424 RepID=UPI002367C6A8|nr:hypothetical protein [Bremerella sp. P1]WDI43325.1 hypothetical protein PSR63_05110 [Bremerella sp. P1]